MRAPFTLPPDLRRHAPLVVTVLALGLFLAWRSHNLRCSSRAAAQYTSAPSAPGLPTPTSVPDATDPLSRAFAAVTGQTWRRYAPKPAALTRDQVDRLKGSAADTTVVSPGPSPTMPGSVGSSKPSWDVARQAAGQVSGLLVGVFG